MYCGDVGNASSDDGADFSGDAGGGEYVGGVGFCYSDGYDVCSAADVDESDALVACSEVWVDGAEYASE